MRSSTENTEEGPQDRGDSPCKGPGVGALLLGHLTNSKDATISMCGVGGGSRVKSWGCYR